MTVHLDNAASLQAVYYYDGAYPGHVYGESGALQVDIDKIPIPYILQTSAQRINKGESVTLTGRLEKQTADGWEPLAGVSGGILFGSSLDVNDLVGGFTTAADGTFSGEYTPWREGFFQVAHQSEDPFISDGSAQSSYVYVLQPSHFRDFTASRTDHRTVHTEGHIDFDDFTRAPSTSPSSIRRTESPGPRSAR
ncbi:hypothetical protein [Streptomyces sp. CA-106110]|uniref:hypothetical protein n=1 Tax=Streptomyces sp. CA-106110 TaxID=3240044 RepID=UPI003D8A0E1D